MTDSQLLVSALSATLVALTIGGLLARNRARLSWAFLFYLVAVFIGNRLSAWNPDRFQTPAFWILKTTAYQALQALVALEIALLTFSELPRARRRTEVFILLVLGTALVAALLPETSSYPYLNVLGIAAPRGATTSLWLFVAVTLMAVRHRAPVHPFHRRLLLAFTVSLGIETLLLKLVGLAADSRPAYLAAYKYLEALDPLCFAMTAGFWAWSAWKAERPTGLGPRVAERLQPWAEADPLQRPEKREDSNDPVENEMNATKAPC
jgi:hypothetical protein